jgi:hypothetical protein
MGITLHTDRMNARANLRDLGKEEKIVLICGISLTQ